MLTWVLLLGLLGGGCRPSGDARRSSEVRPDAPSLRASAAPEASSPPPAAPPSAPAPPPTPPAALTAAALTNAEVTDPGQSFYEALQKTCKLEEGPRSTAAQVDYHSDLERCANRQVRRLKARLTARRERALTAVPESRRRETSDWYPAWNRFVEGACYVADALDWTQGSRRVADTMRQVSLASCLSSSRVDALYWVESYVKGDAARFARYVRAEAQAAEQAEPARQMLRREAVHFAAASSEAPSFDDTCPSCPLFDADWRKLLRTLYGYERMAPVLGDALCRAWPDLARELGGFSECQHLTELYFLASGGDGMGFDGKPGYYVSLADGKPRAPEQNIDQLPPPKDPDYARFVGPLYAACEHDPREGAVAPATRRDCFLDALTNEVASFRRAVGNASARSFGAKLSSYVQDLCMLEQLHSDGLYARDVYPRSFDSEDCYALARARTSFLLRSSVTADLDGFERHRAHRESWGRRVEQGLGRLGSLLEAKACPEDSKDRHVRCRTASISAERWKRAERAHARLLPEVQALAAELCSSWADLREKLGSECIPKLRLHFLSYGQLLGTSDE